MVETVGQRNEIEVGVMGVHEQATRELGEKVCREMADGLVDYVNYLEQYTSQLGCCIRDNRIIAYTRLAKFFCKNVRKTVR